MDLHVKEFYRQYSEEWPDGRFHRVIALHDAADVGWQEIHEQFPMLCKGWYELTSLETKDRIEFTRDYWLAKLPYQVGVDSFIARFFDSLDDVGIYIYQHKFDDPFEVNIVYSLKGNSGFFRGGAASSDEAIEKLKAQFPEFALPLDYVSFLQIHNGFWKTTDSTGLIKIEHLEESYGKFQQVAQQNEVLIANKPIPVNPKKLLPFYESFGMPFFQCFWADWYPDQEMGNVYFSGSTWTIPDVYTAETGPDTMAFPSFLDWLMFYLERID